MRWCIGKKYLSFDYKSSSKIIKTITSDEWDDVLGTKKEKLMKNRQKSSTLHYIVILSNLYYLKLYLNYICRWMRWCVGLTKTGMERFDILCIFIICHHLCQSMNRFDLQWKSFITSTFSSHVIILVFIWHLLHHLQWKGLIFFYVITCHLCHHLGHHEIISIASNANLASVNIILIIPVIVAL